jgi:hypothetical protein
VKIKIGQRTHRARALPAGSGWADADLVDFGICARPRASRSDSWTARRTGLRFAATSWSARLSVGVDEGLKPRRRGSVWLLTQPSRRVPGPDEGR